MPASKKLALVAEDPWLEPYAEDVARRHQRVEARLAEIQKKFGDLKTFAGQHLELGIHPRHSKKSFVYREWAPEAFSLSLIGDFNEWNRTSHPLEKKDGGVWECILPGLAHESRV
ncbi:MAG: 1,4-alpha-glucan-branching enzyme, partial [Spirochaetia bacterium]|nr:1,4-alpha-glucan-branching enzyme [Spirochaetia bacterium]